MQLLHGQLVLHRLDPHDEVNDVIGIRPIDVKIYIYTYNKGILHIDICNTFGCRFDCHCPANTLVRLSVHSRL